MKDCCRLGFPRKLTQRLARRKFIRNLLGGCAPSVKEKGRSKIEQSRKLNCDVVTLEASATNMSPSEAGMTHQNCPKLE